MKKPRALITGGCGFVGRHFACRLVADGYEVTLVDNLICGLPLEQWPPVTKLPGNVIFFETDARDFFRQSDMDFDLVVHLAAVVGGRLMIEGDPLAVGTDLSIDAELFNALARRRRPGQKVLYFSSSAAYPIGLQTRERHVALAESMITFDLQIGVPDMTYGWAKLSGEFLAKYATEKYGMNVAIYRPFSGYAEDQSLDYPFPSIIKRAKETAPPMIVWGSGEQVRDFIHIDDVVEAVMVTKDHLEPGAALNLGTGSGTSMFDYARLALECVGRDLPLKADTSKPEGVFWRVAEPSKMLAYYKPKVTLAEGVDRIARYWGLI
jgi:nucleoside-diphosphate-sugar epimerase